MRWALLVWLAPCGRSGGAARDASGVCASKNDCPGVVLAQNCGSTLATSPNDGEGFEMNNPADTDGIWRSGIFVR